MAGLIKDNDRTLFPIKNISSVLDIFKNQLENGSEPDLALLSIIVGAIENSLTCSTISNSNTNSNRQGFLSEGIGCLSGSSIADDDDNTLDSSSLPTLELHIADALYNKFHSLIKTNVDLKSYHKSTSSPPYYASREIVKRVSDVIWNSLTRSYYKDRAHLQSLYSYLTGNKLDCFGVAFAVVAGCQVLGFSDVHLALSEDHAWVVFGENGTETAEVTWHGKGNEDKRGQSIGPGISSRSWLYVNNCPVVCTRTMEVAALVSAINPSLNATNDAYEVALLQQELLWLLYDLGHLTKYPMALGNLGDLEEIAPTDGRPPCSTLFTEAIESAKTYYNNHHVYPYTYQGGYFYRNKMYKEAFKSWANAADVIRQYNYSRDDEEIYKEFLEIAIELIPYVMKVVSSGHSARSIIKDPECFVYLLRFYDGICQWEEGSATPVLHIGWAKSLVNTISKFDADIRAQVTIICDDSTDTESETGGNGYHYHHPHHQEGQLNNRKPNKNTILDTATNGTKFLNNNNNYCSTKDENDTNIDLIKVIESKVNDSKNDEQSSSNLHPSIVALTAACGEKILNPEYLLQGGGEPFVGGNSNNEDSILSTTNGDELEDIAAGTSSIAKSPPVESNNKLSNEKETENGTKNREEKTITIIKNDQTDVETHSRVVTLYSQKMKGLKELLLAEKLNTHAISLQLTAQSQVQIGGKKGRNDIEIGLRPKRTRRE